MRARDLSGYGPVGTNGPAEPEPEETTRAGHWLYANEPENFQALHAEVVRLQRSIAALIAIGAITEARAYQAYEIAGSCG